MTPLSSDTVSHQRLSLKLLPSQRIVFLCPAKAADSAVWADMQLQFPPSSSDLVAPSPIWSSLKRFQLSVIRLQFRFPGPKQLGMCWWRGHSRQDNALVCRASMGRKPKSWLHRCFGGWKPRRVEPLETDIRAERVYFNLSVCTQATEQRHYLPIGLLVPHFQPTSRSDVEHLLARRAVHSAWWLYLARSDEVPVSKCWSAP